LSSVREARRLAKIRIFEVYQRKDRGMLVRRSLVTAVAVPAAGVIALLSLSCGGGGSPSSSTPVTTVPSQPTPSPPTTGIGDAFYDSSCTLGKGDVNAECSRGSQALLAEVETAMDLLIQQEPQLFDLNDEYAPETKAYKVVDKEGYMNGLVANLRAAGLCSERDADDAFQQTIRVKDSADFSEDYDVILSSGHMRRGTGAYRQSCNPSSFPVDRAEDAPPIGSGCGRPYPPPVTRFNCKVHLRGEVYTLDSTPLVGPDVAYCTSIGFTDGRSLCPVRVEGAPDREACENWRVGQAKDTGRDGPTWTKADGSYCTGPESGCQNHPDTQYQLWTYQSGSYTVTAENGATCTVTH
jgi:hypothetical protein